MSRKKKTETEYTTTVVVNDINEFTEKLEKAAASFAGPRIEIVKAKITKELTLETIYNEHVSDEIINEVTKKCDNIVHQDLQNAFDALKPHLALICDLRDGIKLNPDHWEPEQLSDIEVTGFTLGGDGDHAGVTLIGKKKIGSRVLNLVAPFVKYFDDNDPYKYSDDLSALVNDCINEVQLYLDGKVAIGHPQFDFDSNKNGEEESK